MAEKQKKLPVYLSLFNDIKSQIDEGFYSPGEKLPSVRKLSEMRGLSITTINRAYQELEYHGCVTVLPQSGYYVSIQPDYKPPQTSFEITDPQSVDVIKLVNLVLHDTTDQSLLQFGAGIPPADMLPTPQLNKILIKILQSKSIQQNVTGTAEGHASLREQIVRYMFLLNSKIQPNEILITSGCNEAIYLAFASVCQAGDHVAVETPCYFGILQILQTLGIKVIEIPADPKTGIDLEALKFGLEHYQIKAVYVNSNCNNPLGSTIPTENKKELVKIAGKFNVPIIEDDSTGELYFTKTRPSTVKSFDKGGNVIYCSSFSKVLSPTYRIGWILPGKFINQVTQMKQAINVGTATLQQVTLAEYLDSGQFERHLRRIRRVYSQKVRLMYDAVLNCFPDQTYVTNPQGGYSLWVQLPPKVNALDLYWKLKKIKISICPGAIFTVDHKYDNYLRLSASFYSNELSVFVKALGDQVKEFAR